jgi:U3 small nucleolar RNA-associated protein 15
MVSDGPDVPVWLLSAGGTTIKVWNPITGQCLSTISTQHRKTITSLLPVVRSDYQDDGAKIKAASWRIMTSSVDGLLQFHSWDAATGGMEHLYSTKIGDSITSLAMDSSGDRIAIGTASGEVFVKMRGPSINPKKRTRDPKAGTYSYFQRGLNAEPSEGDFTVTSEGKKRKLRSFDEALKQFRYSDALDDALATRRPRDVVAVLEELGKRRGLTAALANRDEELLEPILSFTIRYINRPHFTGLLIGIAHKLIDVYGDVTGQSETIDELFAKLKKQVGNECRAQKDLLRLVGQIDALMTSSEF